MPQDADMRFMRRALGLAEKGLGCVSPNPMVGAVIIKDGRILAKGFHRKLGGSHAEIEALRKLRFMARGATLYCNLEPCCHHGRTPPCVDAVIRSGVHHVVIAQKDLNPQVAGRSIAMLRKAGIRVTTGVLRNEALFLNRVFNTWMSQRRPYIIIKVAMTLDGKIARKGTPRGKIRWITHEASRKCVHVLRSQVDAVLVGIGTVLKDNPRLNVRGIRGARQPKRVVLDSRLRTPVGSRLLQSRGGEVIIATRSPSKNKAPYFKGQATIWDFPSSRRIPLKLLLRQLAASGVSSILIEGGQEIFASFIKAGLYDEIIFFISPQIWGKTGLDFLRMRQSAYRLAVRPLSVSMHGSDVQVRTLRESRGARGL